jgi:hypothetical protein
LSLIESGFLFEYSIATAIDLVIPERLNLRGHASIFPPSGFFATFSPKMISVSPGRFYGSVAESVGQNGAFRQQAGQSVTRGDRRRRELEARSSSPPLACLLPECLAAFGGNQCSIAAGHNHAVTD